MQQHEGAIPGLSAQAEQVLRLIVREEVQNGIHLALAEPSCPRPCEKVSDLEDAVYGNGTDGVKNRVTSIEEKVENLVWWNRATIVSSLGAVGAVLVSLVR